MSGLADVELAGVARRTARGFGARACAVAWWLLAACAPAAAGQPDQAPLRTESDVGVPGRIEQLVLPGSRLRAKPAEDRSWPVFVRVVSAWSHGDSFRYDLEFMGLEPGLFDLRDYLERVDGGAIDNVPSILVHIKSVLPAGHIPPHALESSWPWLGSYRMWAILFGVVWVVGLLVLILWRRPAPAAEVAARRAPTLAELLAPRLEAAAAGQLDERQLAEIERFIVEFWRRKLGWQAVAPADAVIQLRRHAESGPLLVQLERWIHAPRREAQASLVDLLAPYREFPAQAEDLRDYDRRRDR